jgi:hypothetical protein
MTMDQLELELEMVKAARDIFKGTGPEGAAKSWQSVVDGYTDRINAIEHEIFERQFLV